MEEDHVNVICFDDDENTFLTEEEQRMFSSKPHEKSYEDFEDYRLGFENSIMEVHRQYNVRSKKSQDVPKKSQPNVAVRNSSETIPKKTTESTNTTAKKTELNK